MLAELLLGLLLVFALGVVHHYGLWAISRIRPKADEGPQASVLGTMVALVSLHTVEILAFAVVYKVLLAWGGFGTLAGEFSNSWSDLVYFSGINFVTLGYTQIETSGSIRMINMMQSLGGFMVLTWSATLLYSVCERSWRN